MHRPALARRARELEGGGGGALRVERELEGRARAEDEGRRELEVLDARGLWLGANVVGWSSAVSLAESVTASNQSNCFFIVHRHAAKGFANVSGCRDWIGIAIWTFRVHVDQAHLHSGERIREVAVATVTFVGKPLAFRAPVDILFRFPNVRTSAAETESLESHRL